MNGEQHTCLHEQDFGRFLQICNSEIPEIKRLVTKIFDSIEGNGKPGLKTRTALIEDDIREIREDADGLPCTIRLAKCKKDFEDIKDSVQTVTDKLINPKRIAIQAGILTFSGFIGGFTAMWTIARFYLPDMIAYQLPKIVEQMLPELIK